MRLLTVLIVVAVAGVAAFWVWAMRPPVPPEPSRTTVFDRALIARGAELAAIGNCNVCHTRQDGAPYAGGRPIVTPFGTVHATNITPDLETGIGGWSQSAFSRAMREGVSRDGHHLYPAFPYDHMTKMREEDIRAVYAFIMTRKPVRAAAPANLLVFPFNIRLLVAGWKLLFLDRGPLAPDSSKDAQWNEGAYLVEGLGHCGACHTPRNALGAERRDQSYAGGESEGWTAPALNAASPAAVPWNKDSLYAYLRYGGDSLHGTAAGPMAEVAKNLADVPESDLRAIAAYVSAVAGTPSAARTAEATKTIARAKKDVISDRSSSQPTRGEEIYAGACAQCHGEAGREPAVTALNLALTSTLRMPWPDNVVRIIREGIHSPNGGVGPIMPGFGAVLTEEQIRELVAYLPAHFTDRPPWDDIGAAVRRSTTPETDQKVDKRS